MKIPNPRTKKFRISYLGEFLGDFIRTFNLDLFDRGVARVGDKVYPHTTGIFSSDFENARLDNGATGMTGPTGLTDKLWTVSENGVFHSYQGETFQAGPTGPTFGDSELIAVADETEEDIETVPVVINGTSVSFNLGRFAGDQVRAGQSFKASGPLNEITIEASKVGSPTDNLVVSIQEDDNGIPSGTDLVSSSTLGTDISTITQTLTIELNSIQLDLTKTYWLVVTRSGAVDNSNYYVISYVEGSTADQDLYENGEMKKYDSSWLPFNRTYLLTTVADYTAGGEDDTLGTWTPAEINHTDFGLTNVRGNVSASPEIVYSIDFIKVRVHYTDGTDSITPWKFPTANTALAPPLDAPWTDPTNVYSANGSFATASQGTAKNHCWHNFGFTIPVTATIRGIEVVMNAKASIVTDFPHITFFLTKNKADVVAGSFSRIGLQPHTDMKMSLSTTFPASPERLYATTTDDVVFLNEEKGIWQSLWKGILQKDALNENYPSVMKNIGAGGTLILGNDNKIHTMTATANNPNESEENKIIFNHTHFVNWIAVTSSAIFIGLRHKRSELLPSQICHYEPFAERTRIFTIKEGATVGFTKDENCQIIDKSGQLRVFNGAYFQPYMYFPPYHRNEKITLPHRNGIKVKDNIINFLWEGQYPDPSGIWVLEDGNLYHKHSLVFDTLKSFGSLESTLRALYQEDDIYLGGKVQNASGGQLEGVYSSLNSVDDSKRGQLVTSKMTSPEIDSIWQKMSIRFKDGDFVVKQKEPAKITEGTGSTAFNGEWTTATTFTCSDAGFVSAVDDSKIEIGDEVIVRKGASSGLLAHITNITGTTTKTVTIDSGLATSGTFTFSIENWAKIPVPFRTGKLSSRASLKDERSESKQLKIDMRGTLEELEVKSIPDNSLKVK